MIGKFKSKLTKTLNLMYITMGFKYLVLEEKGGGCSNIREQVKHMRTDKQSWGGDLWDQLSPKGYGKGLVIIKPQKMKTADFLLSTP